MVPEKVQGAGSIVCSNRIKSSANPITQLHATADRSTSHNSLSPTTSEEDTTEKYPQPGDLCTIQYRCYLLGPAENGKDRVRKLFQCTKDMAEEEPPSPIGTALRKRELEIRPPLEFQVGGGHVVRGLDAAVKRMVPSKDIAYEVIIPHLYGYGHRGHLPEIPPQTDLLFEVMLESVEYQSSKSGRLGYSLFASIRKVVVVLFVWIRSTVFWPWNHLRNNQEGRR